MELCMYHVIVQFIAVDDIFPMVSLQTERNLIALTDLMAVSKGKIFKITNTKAQADRSYPVL